jgi:hypothetical protein
MNNGLFLAAVLSLPIVSFWGCASGRPQSTAKAADQEQAPPIKDKEYAALKSDLDTYHAYSYFGPDKKWIFDPDSAETFRNDFAQNYCTGGSALKNLDRASCGRLFEQMALAKLSNAYFAADTAAIQRKCAMDPLVCGDLSTFEVLFRNLHNAEIERSKSEKLAFLERWREGRLTDDELKRALHLDFRFEKGELIVSLPSRPGMKRNSDTTETSVE